MSEQTANEKRTAKAVERKIGSIRLRLRSHLWIHIKLHLLWPVTSCDNSTYDYQALWLTRIILGLLDCKELWRTATQNNYCGTTVGSLMVISDVLGKSVVDISGMRQLKIIYGMLCCCQCLINTWDECSPRRGLLSNPFNVLQIFF